MRKKHPLQISAILLGLFFALMVSVEAQTNLKVYYHDETNQEFTLGDEGKIYFSETELYINNGDQVLSNILISTIRKITVTDNAPNSIVTNSDETGDVIVYPNPAQNHIRIKSSNPEKTTLLILSMNGQVLINKDYYPEDMIDISHLAPGLYVVKIGNITKKISKL